MRIFYLFFILLFLPFFSQAQTIDVSGQCITGTITLSKIFDVAGKAAYQGTGTVEGFVGTTVSVYWIDTPDNVWVVDFDGQPYFENMCNTLLPSGTGDASCPWTTVTGTTCTGGTALVVTGSGVLPVTLINFTAREENNQALLLWETASEINNKGFEIQRSSDAINWNKISFVNGAVNSSLEKSYSFNDVAPLPGNNFYRLVQYDLDGKTTFSNVVNVDIFKAGYYTIGNNPGNGIYRLNINSTNKVIISVIDLTGRRLLSKHIDGGIQQLDISKYAQGTYILRLQIGTEIFTEKLIKL
ncbi:MAG: T9SS type A sorting domain-containing protein [Ginsengibacter sp.]